MAINRQNDSNTLLVENLVTEINTARGIIRPVEVEHLSVPKGKTVGLVGESGSGKSMTAFSLMNLLPTKAAKVKSGTILLGDTNLRELSFQQMQQIRGSRISMIFQDPGLYINPVLTIGDQLLEQLDAHNLANKAPEKIAKVLKEVGLNAEIAERYPHELSGGMLQRIGIASALICDPELIIADEPTTALDVTIQAQILRLLAQIRDERQVSLLLITHDLGIVAEICDEVYIMYMAKIAEYGNVFDIFEDPKHPYTKGLLSGVLSIKSAQTIEVPIKGNIPDFANLPAGCRFAPRCPDVMEICNQEEPRMQHHSEKGAVACWLYASANRREA